MFLANDAHIYVQQAMALRDGDVRPQQGDIRCPTLLLAGDQDPVTPVAWQRDIQAAIPGSRLQLFPDTAHMVMLESPSAFNVALLEFLLGLGPTSGGRP